MLQKHGDEGRAGMEEGQAAFMSCGEVQRDVM